MTVYGHLEEQGWSTHTDRYGVEESPVSGDHNTICVCSVAGGDGVMIFGNPLCVQHTDSGAVAVVERAVVMVVAVDTLW
jgi:hypothetical protein